MYKFFILCFLFFPAIHVFSQDINYEKKLIRELSSERFHGRGYSFNGVNKTAKFLAKEFKSIDLESFGKNYYQPFDLNVNTFPGKVKLELSGQELTVGDEFIVHPSSPSLSGEFPVYTISLNDLDNGFLLQQTLEKAGNGFLLVDERVPDTISVERTRRIGAIKETLLYTREIDLSGLIFLSNRNLLMGISSYSAMRPAFSVFADSLTNENINHIKLGLKAKFEKNFTTKNLIAYIEGASVPDSFIVMSAHYDHLGSMGRKVYFPGANDNASGVAMLLSLAKYFAENPPDYSLVIMAFSAEELGLLGSGYYVDNPLFELNRIKFLLNFDLAGTGDEGIKVVNGTVFQKEFSLLKNINEKNNYLPSVQIRGEACNSDHCPFYSKEVPSFFIYTLGGSMFYHDIHDTAESLSLAGFKGYRQLIIDFTEDLY